MGPPSGSFEGGWSSDLRCRKGATGPGPRGQGNGTVGPRSGSGPTDSPLSGCRHDVHLPHPLLSPTVRRRRYSCSVLLSRRDVWGDGGVDVGATVSNRSKVTTFLNPLRPVVPCQPSESGSHILCFVDSRAPVPNETLSSSLLPVHLRRQAKHVC